MNKITKLEQVLWDNDLEKMLTNHLRDAEECLEDLKYCPQRYQQSEETWEPKSNYYEGKIAGLKKAIKLLKLTK